MSVQLPQSFSRRASGRLRLFLPARLVCGAEVTRAMLCDLSTEGAMVLAPGLDADTNIILRCASFEVPGLVLWSDGQTCGISFDTPVEWENVLATRQEQDERGFSARAAELWMKDATDGTGSILSV